MGKKLILLTHRFPVESGEEFLLDEIKITVAYFDEIIICPDNLKSEMVSIHKLPPNVILANEIGSRSDLGNWELLSEILPVLWSEWISIPSKKLFFSLFKFHLSMLKQCYLKALGIKNRVKDVENTIVYSYWCDDLAITGAFLKRMLPKMIFISRAHGFDVFEEQSDFRHIFFRTFQLKMLDRLWTVSNSGKQHLIERNPLFKNKIDSKYLGIESDAKICFENTNIIRIVTCSHVRSIKRLDLLGNVLKQIKEQQIEWHVIGDGPDLEMLRVLSTQFPSNCKVVFYGYLSIDKIHALYSDNHFDFLVSLSSSEGLPVSMMEAISHGIPILSTDVGGCREIVNEVTGILIPVNFSEIQLSHIISNCKRGYFNDVGKRQAISAFWKTHFFSKVNYKDFAEDILVLKNG